MVSWWKPWSCLQWGSWHPESPKAMLDTIGDIMVEDMKDFLGSSEESEEPGGKLYSSLCHLDQVRKARTIRPPPVLLTSGIQNPWLLSGPSHRPTPANLWACEDYAKTCQPAYGTGPQTAQMFWARFILAPPTGKWLPWRPGVMGRG